MEPRFQRTIAADLESLRRLLVDLVEFLEQGEVPPKASHDVQVVCEELIVNAIRHGLGTRSGAGPDANHRIELSLALGDAISIQIRDDLPLFDPTAVPVAMPARSLAAAPAGGRGLGMVRRAAKQFRWRAEGLWNVVDVEIPLRRH